MYRLLATLMLLLAFSLNAAVALADPGAVAGIVIESGSNRPLSHATLVLRRLPAGDVVRRGAVDADGRFDLNGLEDGEYDLAVVLPGGEVQEAPRFTISAAHRRVDLGTLSFAPGAAVQMEKMQVSAGRDTFYNSIDRKVYSVGLDLQSTAGSASGLLQNVPSVQVDVEGNVSLRGNDNVLILIDGKPSSLMSIKNRGDVLQQMPADSIQRIEVITNPSAKYKPDGTAGIINIVTKQEHKPGFSGVLHANIGSGDRANASFTGNYNPGPYNLSGMISVRQDDRLRTSSETRRHVDAASGALIDTVQSSTEHMRPLSRLAQLGIDFPVTTADRLHAGVSYNYLSFFRTSTVGNFAQTVGEPASLDYNRNRTDPEWHKTLELDLRDDHAFEEPGRKLSVEVKHEWHQELENNHYTNVYTVPVQPVSLDYTRMHPTDTTDELTADYTHPFANGGKLSAGYAGDADTYDTDFRAGTYDPLLAQWTVDPTQTNHFIYKDWIHAMYATFGRSFGSFSFLAGARLESTLVRTDLVTMNQTDETRYNRVHPSLHLTYDLTDTRQLQLNYSHRVRRPESDDLNPFPEYQDPYNLREGNPKLRPEETHSIEAGYQYHDNETTYLADVYFRDTYHAFTTVTRYIDAVTLLTTHENLATNRSGGLELVATTPLGAEVDVNASANAFYSEVDATNLGLTGNRSGIAWNGKANLEWRPNKPNLVQLNLNYTGRRLTAQGYRLPTFYANIGLRHDFKNRNLAFVLTVSDIFNSLKERTIIDTPTLHDDLTRRRSSRTVYAGFAYSFGSANKKAKGLEFDSAD